MLKKVIKSKTTKTKFKEIRKLRRKTIKRKRMYDVYSSIDFIGIDTDGYVSSHRTRRAAVKTVIQLVKNNPDLKLKHFGIYKGKTLIWHKVGSLDTKYVI